MSEIAGFCLAAHPLAASEAGERLAHGLLAVRQPRGELSPADWYALAARWCALGGFVPMSWRRTIAAGELRGLGAQACQHIREAIGGCAGRVEIAFQLERAAANNQGASPGRAYLAALRGDDEIRRGFLGALSAAVAELGYALSLTTATRVGVSGLLRCRAEEFQAARYSINQIAGDFQGAALSVSGPLPPFGAGVELVERLGLDKARRAA